MMYCYITNICPIIYLNIMVTIEILVCCLHFESRIMQTTVVMAPSKCNAKPTPIVSCFRGDISLTRLNNFRLTLLLHCAALNEDTAIFHPRIDRSRDPTCSLCNKDAESPLHFICICPALQDTRASWIPSLPGFTTPPKLFHHVMFHQQFQEAFILFLADLQRKRLSLL